MKKKTRKTKEKVNSKEKINNTKEKRESRRTEKIEKDGKRKS